MIPSTLVISAAASGYSLSCSYIAVSSGISAPYRMKNVRSEPFTDSQKASRSDAVSPPDDSREKSRERTR